MGLGFSLDQARDPKQWTIWWGHPRGDTCPILGLVRFANSTEKARLAIVPGYSHYNFVSATELAAIIDKYLADPLTNAPAGAAVASQAAPELTKSTSH